MNEQPNDATTHTTQNMGLDELPQFADTPQGDVPPEPVSPEAKAAAKRRSNRQFIAILVAMSVMLVVGVGLILYPTVADAWNRHVASRAVAGYVEQVADTSKEDREAQLARAREYNESLVGRGVTRFLPTEEEKKEYNAILDITGTGIMGYVTIPKIDARLPIYHGTDEAVLQIASGHMEGSSFPIGGESTHAVLTGHTGLPSAMLFTGIDTLEKGDTFTVTVYDDVLTYEVEETHVVLPDNVKNLEIQKGRDLVSLVTCTPYGVNSHRLIVTGTRIPTPEEAKHATYENKALKQDMLITVIITVATIAALVTVFTVQRRRLRCGQAVAPCQRQALAPARAGGRRAHGTAGALRSDMREKRVVGASVPYTGALPYSLRPGSSMNKAIITVVGQDTVGIIARVCTYLSEHHTNVLDISQTIIDGFFNMMMIVDYSDADVAFETIVEDLEALGEDIGVRIRCQLEEIFTKMHRV